MLPSRSGMLFILPIFVALLPLAQVPVKTPESTNAVASSPAGPHVFSAAESAALQDLASRLLSHMKHVCKHHDCKILVTNFLSPEGDTSAYGMELADQLSQILANDGKHSSIVGRAPMQEMFRKDRLRSRDMESDDRLRWLGRHFGADVVLMGRTVQVADGAVRLFTRFLAASEKDKDEAGTEEEIRLAAPGSAPDLTPRELYSPLPPFDTSQFPGKVYPIGTKGNPPVSCFYMPNPRYTEDARIARFSGSVLLDAVIDTDGSVKAARIRQGSCCGLNESALQTMTLWKCHPLMVDDKPVPVVIDIVVAFRWFRGG